MIKRIAGFAVITLAATAVALGAATVPAQAGGDTKSGRTSATQNRNVL